MAKKHSLINYLKLEYGLYSRYYGKVFIFTGPESSGKTALMYSLINSNLLNFVTIPRKKIILESLSLFEKKFFRKFLDRAEQILQVKIQNLDDLYKIPTSDLSSDNYSSIELLKQDISIQFKLCNDDFFIINFTSYYKEIKKYIFSGYNVIIDETMKDDIKLFDIFRYCCGNYSSIKIVLLYSTLEEILNKCIIRNNKFLFLLDQAADVENFKQQIKEDIVSSNSSSIDFREPKSIVELYIHFYDFKRLYELKKQDYVLDTISKSFLEKTIEHIFQEQLKLEESLKEKHYHLEKKYINMNPKGVVKKYLIIQQIFA